MAALVFAFSLFPEASSGQTRSLKIDEGKKLYERHCLSCHGKNGEPRMPGAPDMRRGEGLLKPERVIFDTIMNGKFAMPAYRGILTEDEALSVISYIRMFY
ncbi:MAG: c-type cytochrome [Candidatus Nitrospinota bacterium M3_3B_026]